MPKLKDIALGILVVPVLIPIMLIASYQDKKAIKKELEQKNPHKIFVNENFYELPIQADTPFRFFR